jgi:hypothetical protein
LSACRELIRRQHADKSVRATRVSTDTAAADKIKLRYVRIFPADPD